MSRPFIRLLLVLLITTAVLPGGVTAQDPLPTTFDYMLGTWTIDYRWRLPDGTYLELDGIMEARRIMSGLGIVDEWRLDPEGPNEVIGLSIRVYDADSRQWHVNWVDGTRGVWGTPATGGERGETVIRLEGSGRDAQGSHRIIVTISDIRSSSFSWRQDRVYEDGTQVTGQIIQHYQRVSDRPPILVSRRTATPRPSSRSAMKPRSGERNHSRHTP